MIPTAIELKHKAPFVGLLLFLIGLPVLASTDAKWFTRAWMTDDGLINNNIQAIVQGPDGYLWVAPSVGLMQFDGIRFSPFPLEEFTGPVDNHIRTMLCGRTGVLWIAMTSGAVLELKPDLSTVTFLNTKPSIGGPLTLAEDAGASLWLGYPDDVCRITAGQVTRFTRKEGVPAGDFHSLINDGAGNIWLAKGNQICVFRDGQFQEVLSTGARCLAATPTNAIWFVTGNHLWTCDTERVARDHGEFPDLAHATRRGLLEDHTGAVWIGTDGNGLIHYDESGFQKIETSYPSIYTLAEDREGNLWVGMAGGGLNQVSLSEVRLESVPVSECIESICEDDQGRLWGSTHNGMLASRVDGKWTPVFTNAPFAGTVTTVAANRHGGIWFGTRDGKLLQLDNTNYSMVQSSFGQIISALQPTPEGDLWILGSDKLQCLHDGKLKNPTLPRKVNRFSGIAEDAKGNIWVGATGVVMRFDGKNFVDESSLLPISNRTICCLYPALDGSIWFSCGGVGLVRFKNEQVSQIGVEQGLPNNYIAQIVADDCGWLWFCSDHGIFKIRRQELEQAFAEPSVHLSPVIYGRNEGLSLEALFIASSPALPLGLRSRDGRVWLLTHTGVAVANPNAFPEYYPSPPVLVTRFAVDEQTIASYGKVTSTQTVANLNTLSVPLRLPPSHRHLEFDFTAFHFSAPENIHFRYKLAGFDNDWIEAGTRHSVDYTRLTAGDYEFRVEACIGGGPWSPSTPLAFIVDPFFWQTWWFRLGVLLAFASSLIAAARYISIRRIQARMRLLEQRAALDKERTRIARDLHDELGSSLNYISMSLGDMRRPEEIHNEKFQTRLEKISQFAVRTVRSLDEIVWAVNPRNDSLRSLAEYVTQLAGELFEDRNIRCRFHIAEHLPEMQLTPEMRHDLFLAVKEALGNALVHAHATEVQLGIKTAGTHVEISIQDNGTGFNRETIDGKNGSNGLRNMQQRMDAIGGRLVIRTNPGEGTTVLLTVAVSNGSKSDNSGGST